MMQTPSGQRTRDRLPGAEEQHGPSRGTCEAAALISAVVGAIHLAVVAEHLAHWWVYGAFFLVVGLFQLALAAVILRRPTVVAALTGVVVNVVIVLVYVTSRTVGIPIAPPAGAEGDGDGHGGGEGAGGHAEDVGALDLAATAGELVLVALLVSMLPDRLRRVTVNALLLVGIALWGLRLSGALG